MKNDDIVPKLMKNVLRFITTLRNSFSAAEEIYLNGGCYQLYRILKLVYPDAQAYMDKDFHILTKIGDKFYDITGQVQGDDFVLLTQRWHKKVSRCTTSTRTARLCTRTCARWTSN